jgi:hypothetical protein
MIKVGMSLLILTLSASALAESSITTPDLTGAIGDYGFQTGSRGAVVNRRLADQLYKQSLEDEKNAWKSFPPNVSLLSRALAYSKDGKTADDQAKEFARAALHGMVSGNQSGPFDAASHGIVSVDELKNLAEKNSPYQKQVENKLNSYGGMHLDADKMVLKTPVGDFSVNISREAMETGMRAFATLTGYNPDDVTKGIQDAARLRDQLAAETMKQVDAELAAKAKAAGQTPEQKTAADAENPGAEAQSGQAQPEGARDPATAVAALDPATLANESDWDAKQREFQMHQAAIARSLGMQVQSVENKDPLGSPNQNLFQMIHDKYQAMRGDGVFLETMDPLASAKAK